MATGFYQKQRSRSTTRTQSSRWLSGVLPARGLLDEAELQSLVDQRLLDLGEKFFALVRGAESEPMLSIVRVTGRSHTTELDLRALEN